MAEKVNRKRAKEAEQQQEKPTKTSRKTTSKAKDAKPAPAETDMPKTGSKQTTAKNKDAAAPAAAKPDLDSSKASKTKKKATADAEPKAHSTSPEVASKPAKRKTPAAEPDAATEQVPPKQAKSATEVGKEKRRERAAASFEMLQDLKIPDLPLPEECSKLSFTLFDPAEQGSSIYAILNSENFFVTNPVDKSVWPSTCQHLKVRMNQFLCPLCS